MNSIVHPNVLKGIEVLGNVVINGIPFQVGQMIDGAPLRRMFCGDHAEGMTLKMG